MRDDFNDEETVEVWLDFFEALKKTQYQAALETSIFTMAYSTTKFEVDFKIFQEELTQLSKEVESAKEGLGNNIDKTLAAQLQTSLNKLLEFCNDFAKSQFPVELTQEQIDNSTIPNNDLDSKILSARRIDSQDASPILKTSVEQSQEPLEKRKQKKSFGLSM